MLGTEDVRAAYDAVSSRGVTFDGEAAEAFWGMYVTFSDPGGNGLVPAQPPAA